MKAVAQLTEELDSVPGVVVPQEDARLDSLLAFAFGDCIAAAMVVQH